ncbi:MAG: sodium:glutamate symporter [Candidatus Eisenbacteria bacterium]|nr:sodium:glutamate symporter [Candidatus Eisenbacteria bacterium]
MDRVVLSFCFLSLLLLLGQLIRARVRWTQRLLLPASVIGGILGLAVIQLVERNAPGAAPFMSDATAGWGRLPGLLINVVFATLFLGAAIPPLRRVWRISGPQLAYGQVVAWGQYAVGLGLTLLILVRFFDIPPMFGAIIPVGFEGGHGTAAGLAGVFTEKGWPDGVHLALGSATVGVVGGVAIGMALINWAARRRYCRGAAEQRSDADARGDGIFPRESRPKAGLLTFRPESVESLAVHLAVVGVAVLFGYGLKVGLSSLESLWLDDPRNAILGSFPLFPLAMIGGVVVQKLFDRFDRRDLLDRGTMQRLQGLALDYLIVAALATLKIEAIVSNLTPFVLLMLAGIAWNVWCVVFLARRMLPDNWFERGVAEFGQSMGVTATGILLLRVADPRFETKAPDAFGYKQLLHEPFMGGGLWTSTVIPLLYVFRANPWPIWWITVGAIAVWLVVRFVFFRRAWAPVRE